MILVSLYPGAGPAGAGGARGGSGRRGRSRPPPVSPPRFLNVEIKLLYKQTALASAGPFFPSRLFALADQPPPREREKQRGVFPPPIAAPYSPSAARPPLLPWPGPSTGMRDRPLRRGAGGGGEGGGRDRGDAGRRGDSRGAGELLTLILSV